MRDQYADRFYLVNSKEDKRKDILTEFFKDKDGVLLTEQLKEEWTNELGVCEFKRKVAGKKDCKDNSTLIYKKEYLQINMDDSGG